MDSCECQMHVFLHADLSLHKTPKFLTHGQTPPSAAAPPLPPMAGGMLCRATQSPEGRVQSEQHFPTSWIHTLYWALLRSREAEWFIFTMLSQWSHSVRLQNRNDWPSNPLPIVPGGRYKLHLSHLPKAQRYLKMFLIFINSKIFKSDY